MFWELLSCKRKKIKIKKKHGVFIKAEKIKIIQYLKGNVSNLILHIKFFK